MTKLQSCRPPKNSHQPGRSSSTYTPPVIPIGNRILGLSLLPVKNSSAVSIVAIQCARRSILLLAVFVMTYTFPGTTSVMAQSTTKLGNLYQAGESDVESPLDQGNPKPGSSKPVFPTSPVPATPTKRVPATPTQRISATPTSSVSATPTQRVSATPTSRISATPTPRVPATNTPRVATPTATSAGTFTPRATATAQHTQPPFPTLPPWPTATRVPGTACHISLGGCASGQLCCPFQGHTWEGRCRTREQCCRTHSDCRNGQVCCMNCPGPFRECKERDDCCRCGGLLPPSGSPNESVCEAGEACCNTDSKDISGQSQVPTMECLPVGTGAWPITPPRPPPSNWWQWPRNNWRETDVRQCLPTCDSTNQNRYYGPENGIPLYCCRTECTGDTSNDFRLISRGSGSYCVFDNDWSTNGNAEGCINTESYASVGCPSWGEADPTAEPFELLCPQEPGVAQSFCNGNLVVPLDLGYLTAFYNHQRRKWHTPTYEPDEGFGCNVSVLERIYSDDILTVHHTADRSETRFINGQSEFVERGDLRTLSGGAGGWIMRNSDGTETIFSQKVANFTYPTEVHYPDGRKIVFTYLEPKSPILDSVAFPDNRRLQFYSEKSTVTPAPISSTAKRHYTLWTDEYQRKHTVDRPLTFTYPAGEQYQLRLHHGNHLSLVYSYVNREVTVFSWSLNKFVHDPSFPNFSLSGVYTVEDYRIKYTRDASGLGKIALTDAQNRALKSYLVDYYNPQDRRTAYIAQEFRKGQLQISRKLDAEGKLVWQKDPLNQLTEYFYGGNANCSTADLSNDYPFPTCIKQGSQTVRIERASGNYFRPTLIRNLGTNQQEISALSLVWNGARLRKLTSTVGGKEYRKTTYQYSNDRYYPTKIDSMNTVEAQLDPRTGLPLSTTDADGAINLQYDQIGMPTSIQVGGLSIGIQRDVSSLGERLRFGFPSGAQIGIDSTLSGEETLTTLSGVPENGQSPKTRSVFEKLRLWFGSTTITGLYSENGETEDLGWSSEHSEGWSGSRTSNSINDR